MNMINPESLAETLDNVNNDFFYKRTLSISQKEKIAKWIAVRQGLQYSYANMFAPTLKDINEGIKVFTGERIQSRVAIRHILGEEACRALILLDVTNNDVINSLNQASTGMMNALKRSEEKDGLRGCPRNIPNSSYQFM